MGPTGCRPADDVAEVVHELHQGKLEKELVHRVLSWMEGKAGTTPCLGQLNQACIVEHCSIMGRHSTVSARQSIRASEFSTERYVGVLTYLVDDEHEGIENEALLDKLPTHPWLSADGLNQSGQGAGRHHGPLKGLEVAFIGGCADEGPEEAEQVQGDGHGQREQYRALRPAPADRTTA